MKKSVLLITIILSILLITGCNGTVTREIRQDGFNLMQDSLVCKALIPEKEGLKANKKILYMNQTMAYSKDGDIYEMSMGQKYANGENCKKVNTSFKVDAYMDDNIVKGKDNKFYYTISQSNNNNYSEVNINDDSYAKYKILLDNKEVKKVITIDESNGIYYVLLDDGNVYKYIITRDEYNEPYKLKYKTIIYDSNDLDGKIIDFNFDGGTKEKTYLKTKNTIYRMQVTNKNKCTKYADVECKYSLKKDDILTKYYNNKILYYGSDILITTYGRTFN